LRVSRFEIHFLIGMWTYKWVGKALIITSRFGSKIGAANGTSGARREPDVDAVSMKCMATRRHQTQRFIVLKLVQANGTFHATFADL
jgi:hypothetical protein